MAFAQLNLIHSYEILPSVLINNCVLCWRLSIRWNTVTNKNSSQCHTHNSQAASKISLNLYIINCRTEPIKL